MRSFFRRARAQVATKVGSNPHRRTLAADISYVLVTQILSRGVLNVVNILAANFLSVLQFTAYNYFLITTNLVAAGVGVGLPVAATKVVAEASPDDRPDYAGKVAAILYLIGGSTLAAILLSPIVLPLLSPDEVQVSPILLMLGACALAWFGIMQGGLQGASAFRAVLLPVSIGSGLLLATCALSWWSASELPLIVGLILFYIVPAALFVRQLSRMGLLPKAVLRAPPSPALRDIAATALPSLGNALIFTAVNWWIARVLIENQGSQTAFAQFVIGMQWFSLALFVPLAVGQVIFPRYIKLAQTSAISWSASLKPAMFACLLVLMLILVAVPATPLLSLIYGSNFDFSAWFVLAMLGAAALSAPAGVLGQAVIAMHGARMWFWVFLVYLILGFALPFFWPPTSELDAAILLAIVNAGLLATAIATLYLMRRERRPSEG
jgi:O-antigen/teichoic acid export membrane protein